MKRLKIELPDPEPALLAAIASRNEEQLIAESLNLYEEIARRVAVQAGITGEDARLAAKALRAKPEAEASSLDADRMDDVRAFVELIFRDGDDHPPAEIHRRLAITYIIDIVDILKQLGVQL